MVLRFGGWVLVCYLIDGVCGIQSEDLQNVWDSLNQCEARRLERINERLKIRDARAAAARAKLEEAKRREEYGKILEARKLARQRKKELRRKEDEIRALENKRNAARRSAQADVEHLGYRERRATQNNQNADARREILQAREVISQAREDRRRSETRRMAGEEAQRASDLMMQTMARQRKALTDAVEARQKELHQAKIAAIKSPAGGQRWVQKCQARVDAALARVRVQDDAIARVSGLEITVNLPAEEAAALHIAVEAMYRDDNSLTVPKVPDGLSGKLKEHGGKFISYISQGEQSKIDIPDFLSLKTEIQKVQAEGGECTIYIQEIQVPEDKPPNTDSNDPSSSTTTA